MNLGAARRPISAHCMIWGAKPVSGIGSGVASLYFGVLSLKLNPLPQDGSRWNSELEGRNLSMLATGLGQC
jgi:hypothetical protein